MSSHFSVAHLRSPEEALLPSAFSDGSYKFMNCFKFKPDDGLKLLNLFASAMKLNPVEYKKVSRYPFDITFFSTISYLVRGEIIYLKRNHKTYKNYSTRGLLKEVPKICRKLIYCWYNSYVRFPFKRTLVEERLKAFKDKMCPNIVGVMRVYNFRVRSFPINVEPYFHSQISVQFVCDDRGRFNDVHSSINPLIEDESQLWLTSEVRQAMMSIKEEFGDVYLATLDDYSPEEDLLLTPNSLKLQGQDQMEHDPKIQKIMLHSIFELKARFMCLMGKLPYYPYESMHVIKACAILHNVIIEHKMVVLFSTNE